MFKNYTPSALTDLTPDEELDAPVEQARRAVAEAVNNSYFADQIGEHLIRLAEAEGQRDTAYRFVRVLRNGFTRERAAMHVMDDITQRGADDTWSGRNNEVKRAHYDGRREMAHELFSAVLSD